MGYLLDGGIAGEFYRCHPGKAAGQPWRVDLIVSGVLKEDSEVQEVKYLP